jgi:GWxTD domain-containing protein
MSHSTFRSLTAATLAILVSFASINAQQIKPSPDEKPRKVKEELKTAYKDWIDDVRIILTQSEQDGWKKLKTDDEREEYIKYIWHLRDPDPDTEENEYKDQFYERVAYANEHFTSGKAGRLTDRGRIYIKFGKPDDVESHPSGGTYNRPYNEGGGSTSTYPFEKWFYRYIPEVGSGIELEFVDPTGSGEFRLARNPDEKDALIYVPGAGRTLFEELGIADRGERITGIGSYGRVNYLRAQDSPFEVLNLHRALDAPLARERNPFEGTTINTPVVEDNPLNFTVQPHYFRQSDNQVLVALTVQADNSELTFVNSGGLQKASLNIFGRVRTIAEKQVGKFEDAVTTTATPEELSAVLMRKSANAKAFILAPGRYRVDLFLRDIESGAAGIQRVGINVPHFPADKLATSSIVLATKLEDLSQRPSGGQFVIGTKKVIPNISGVFRQGDPVGIYLQVYNAAIDQTLLRPAVDVTYVLLKDGKEIRKESEDWRELDDAGQRLTLTRLFDSGSLTPGDYDIQVRLHDRVTGESITPTTKFTVVQN